MGRSQAEHMAEQLAAALTRAAAAEAERDAARGVLADMLAGKTGGDLYAASVQWRDSDRDPDELLLRARTVEDALARIREDHCSIIISGWEDEGAAFDVRLWRVLDDRMGVLTHVLIVPPNTPVDQGPGSRDAETADNAHVIVFEPLTPEELGYDGDLLGRDREVDHG